MKQALSFRFGSLAPSTEKSHVIAQQCIIICSVVGDRKLLCWHKYFRAIFSIHLCLAPNVYGQQNRPVVMHWCDRFVHGITTYCSKCGREIVERFNIHGPAYSWNDLCDGTFGCILLPASLECKFMFMLNVIDIGNDNCQQWKSMTFFASILCLFESLI